MDGGREDGFLIGVCVSGEGGGFGIGREGRWAIERDVGGRERRIGHAGSSELEEWEVYGAGERESDQ